MPWYKSFSGLNKKQKPGALGNIIQGEATLDFFINVSCRFDLTTNSECVWVNNNQIILTMNNNFYIIDLKHNDLIRIIGDFAVFMYGVQQVNMKVFCTVVRRSMNNIEKARKYKEQIFQSVKLTKKTNMMLIEA